MQSLGRVWRRSRGDDGVPRPQFQEMEIKFTPLEVPGPVLHQFSPNSDPLRVFKSMLGGEFKLSLLREATNNYIAEFWS
jgi:hypothetical protein